MLCPPFIKTLPADDPLCRLQRPTRETFAAAGGVAERDRVGGGIETDFVRPGVGSGAAGGGVDGAFIAGFTHGFHESKQGSRRAVLLGRMMDLPRPCAIFGLVSKQARGFDDQTLEDVHADGEIGAPDETDAVSFDGGFDLVLLIEPSGRADHGVDPQAREFINVSRDGMRDGEIDCDIQIDEITA